MIDIVRSLGWDKETNKMAFVKEYPVSQELLNRFDWTALPLLYQGEAGVYCSVPTQLLVDYENDLVYYIGGGGVGRTTRIIQPDTQVLYYKCIPIRFVYESTSVQKYKNEETGRFVFDWVEWTVNRVVAPSQLKNQETDMLLAIEKACEAAAFSKDMARPKSLTVKIATKVEYI